MKITVKNMLVMILTAMSVAIYAQDNDGVISLDWEMSIESLPYAPINGTTIGDNPVVIGQVSAKLVKTSTSVIYYKSFDAIGGNEGGYDAFFLIQPIQAGKQKIKMKAIHFADFGFKDRAVSALALQAYGGEKIKWSVQITDMIFEGRSPRWIINPSISQGNFTINSWTYHEHGQWSQTFGLQYKSKKFSMSKSYDIQIAIRYNDSVTHSGFGQDDTAMVGVIFTPAN